jgi:hypothetical protein
MNNDLTIWEAVQALQAWVATLAQAFQTWVRSLGDIRVSTLLTVAALGVTVSFGLVVLDWLLELEAGGVYYHRRGYPWRRTFRLAQADIEEARTKRRQQTNPYYKGQPSAFAAPPPPNGRPGHRI